VDAHPLAHGFIVDLLVDLEKGLFDDSKGVAVVADELFDVDVDVAAVIIFVKNTLVDLQTYLRREPEESRKSSFVARHGVAVLIFFGSAGALVLGKRLARMLAKKTQQRTSNQSIPRW